MPSLPFPSRPEVLENRIAPAVYFLSGTTFDVLKFSSADPAGVSVNNVDLANAVAADLAVVLKKGDSLVLDIDGNNKFDPGETVLVKVAGGTGVFFFKDLNGSSSVDAEELTGIAAGAGLSATINGDVNGDVATTFAADGTLTPDILNLTSIAGLKVTGQVTGSILAGGNISGITIGPAMAVPTPSVTDIRAGSATFGQTISYDGGTQTFSTDMAIPAPGAAGGSISKVTLAGGATNILAGRGADSIAGAGGKGGSISTVKMFDTPGDFSIIAGDGGDSLKVGAKGGAGGGVTGVNITSAQTAADGTIAFIRGGQGGQGDSGGAGGAVTGGSAKFLAATGVYLYIYGGNGGAGGVPGGKAGSGGAGGSVSALTLSADASFGFAGFYGGDGSDAAAGSNGKGGAGGSVSKITYKAFGSLYAPDFEGGDGGNGLGTGAGGAGGSLSVLSIDQGDSMHGQQILGGAGGDAVNGKAGAGGAINGVTQTTGALVTYMDVHAGAGGTSLNGAGGAGGKLNKWTLSAADVGERVEGFAGNGGNSTTGKGGAGGALSGVTATLGAVTAGSATFAAGNGGLGGALGGGVGGATSKVNVTLGGHVGAIAAIYSGNGGDAGAGDGKGGAGGALSGIVVTKSDGAPDSITISSGNGGASSGKGIGANGGAVSKVTYNGTQPAHALYIGSGDGGDSPGDGARGGNGGAVSTVTLSIPGTSTVDEAAVIYGGNGGAAGGEGGKGGNGGSISTLMLDALTSTVRVNNGTNHGDLHGGDGGSGLLSAGGKGGSITNIKGRVGLLLVSAQRGGSAEMLGGDGGSVSTIFLNSVGQFVQLIAGGVGGNSGMDGTPGRGGNLSGITIPDDIGNFDATFGLDPLAVPGTADPQMGGLIAGLAGSKDGADVDPARNGTISGIAATRIAAILAGSVIAPGGVFDGTKANGLTQSNAVSKITKIAGVSKLGADAIMPTGFTFIDNNPGGGGNGMFQLGDGDTAQDGLVIVLGTTTVLPVAPLRFEEVVIIV